jgi:hypothetical protein
VGTKGFGEVWERLILANLIEVDAKTHKYKIRIIYEKFMVNVCKRFLYRISYYLSVELDVLWVLTRTSVRIML